MSTLKLKYWRWDGTLEGTNITSYNLYRLEREPTYLAKYNSLEDFSKGLVEKLTSDTDKIVLIRILDKGSRGSRMSSRVKIFRNNASVFGASSSHDDLVILRGLVNQLIKKKSHQD